MTTDQSHPRVSVIIACRNVGRYIDVALDSIRRQSLADLEILLVDDRSTDDTRERALRHAAEDQRVIMLDGTGSGPGAARNLALASARGDWVAIVDGDDLIHPRRFETLAHVAEQSGADIIADNLIAFQDNPADGRPYFLLPMPDWEADREIDLAFFIRSNALFGRGAPLGYLKPLIRRDVLSRTGTAYDPTLRIGEDYDLVAQLLAQGARYCYFPAAFYFYRRHSASTSFRLAVPDVEAMIAAADAFAGNFQSQDTAIQRASTFRRDSLVRALRFSQLLADITARRWGAAALALVSDLSTPSMFAQAALSGTKRRLRQLWRGNKMMETARPRAVLLWQGAPSSAEALCADLAGRNYDICLIRADRNRDQATPAISAALALRLAGEADAELLMCDDADLMPDLSYALSPTAIVELIRPAGAGPAMPLELEP
jgi:succinoglycan biosynthesis protein ExoO